VLATVATLVVGSAVSGALTARAEEAGGEAADTVLGELVRAWIEPSPYEEGERSAEEGLTEPVTWVEPETGPAVRVLGAEVADVPVGTTVEVEVGAEVPDEAATEAGMAPAREVLDVEVLAAAEETPTASAAPPYTNEVTVVMVLPPGGIQDGTTLAGVVAAVNGPAADFWESESNGQVRSGVTRQFDRPRVRGTTSGSATPGTSVAWTPSSPAAASPTSTATSTTSWATPGSRPAR
jgi:hypothetical protein